jgi:hypothetical protein
MPTDAPNDVVHEALPVDGETGWLAQPAIGVPESLKLTVPCGAPRCPLAAATSATSVTCWLETTADGGTTSAVVL